MRRPRKKTNLSVSSWTTDQDCFLIENSSLALIDLTAHLPYTEDEIKARKIILGLMRRDKQFRKL